MKVVKPIDGMARTLRTRVSRAMQQWMDVLPPSDTNLSELGEHAAAPVSASDVDVDMNGEDPHCLAPWA